MSERKVFHSSHEGDRWHVLLDGQEQSVHETQEAAEHDAISRAKTVRADGGLSQVICHNTLSGVRESLPTAATLNDTKAER